MPTGRHQRAHPRKRINAVAISQHIYFDILRVAQVNNVPAVAKLKESIGVTPPKVVNQVRHGRIRLQNLKIGVKAIAGAERRRLLGHHQRLAGCQNRARRKAAQVGEVRYQRCIAQTVATQIQRQAGGVGQLDKLIRIGANGVVKQFTDEQIGGGGHITAQNDRQMLGIEPITAEHLRQKGVHLIRLHLNGQFAVQFVRCFRAI